MREQVIGLIGSASWHDRSERNGGAKEILSLIHVKLYLNENTMKPTIILISSFLLTVSCLSHKATQKTIDSSSDVKRKDISVATQWLSQLEVHDSSRVVWQFRTDAPFAYHPNTGLHAEKGDLLLTMQSAHWRHFIKDSNNRTIYVEDSQQQHEEQVTMSERRPNTRKAAWWIVGILLLVGGLYIVWKYITPT